ncbi:tripartite tricarboxylate transporter substrate binding protein [Micrococcus terreus]|uniref:Bug family tripartite tricarboxylate transporter substrate binding protein n=1 Tax=Micrococcus terreus TaxID=574650 RepID=UPI0034001EE6
MSRFGSLPSNSGRPTRRRVLQSISAAAVAGLLLSGCASNSGGGDGGDGDAFPTKDIRLVVPWAAGGSGDLSARTIAPLLEDELGVNVIVENRPGANGSVGYNWLKEQEPDGYNLSMLGAEVVTLQFMDYDIKPADYDFLGQIISGPGAIAVKADSPYQSLQDIIDDAKANPGKVTYSSPGVGSVWDNPAQGFQELAGIELTNVPFDGSAPSVAAAAAGDVSFSIDAVGTQKAQVDGGAMRYIAVLTDERLEELPDVPTAKEEGVDLQNASFTGLMAPAGTPDEVVKTLSDAIVAAAAKPEYQDVISESNLIPVGTSSSDFEAFIQGEEERYGPWIEMAQSKEQ